MENESNIQRDNFKRKAPIFLFAFISIVGLYAITENHTQEHTQEQNTKKRNSVVQVSLTDINKAPLSQEQLLEINPKWSNTERKNGTAAILSNGTNNVLFILESSSQSKKDALFRSFRNNPNNENWVNANFETHSGHNLYVKSVVSMQSNKGNIEYRVEYTDKTGEINNTAATSGIKVTISSNAPTGIVDTQNFNINP